MRRERPRLGSGFTVAAFGAVALVVLAVAAFFLHDVQERQRSDLRSRYADRVVVASALLDSLFAVAFGGQVEELRRSLSGPSIGTAELDERAREGNARWAAVVAEDGRLLGASSRAPRATLQAIADRPFFRAALGPRGYGLGSVDGDELPTAAAFPGPEGRRVLVSGANVATFAGFLEGTLQSLPGVRQARAYVFDGNGARIAAAAQGIAVPAQTPALLEALAREPTGTFEAPNGEGTRFFATRPIQGTRWRLVVTVGTDVLYASASGADRAVPWVILGLTALALLGVTLLLRRLIGSASALRRANAELETSNAELARSNADLEQFAYAASHDLSEPLRTVAGFSQLLGKRYRGKLDPDADVFIQHMTTGVDRMQQLIDDLLLYSRVGRAPVGSGPVDLDEVLDEVLHALGPAIRAQDAEIVSDPLPTVRGEHGQMRQVLQNLVANAMKFTAPGVTPRVVVSAAREGECWQVRVADNGIGIADDQREAVFKMFGRLHPADAYPGTGIGLALVKRIVERHGGRIWVEPASGAGSVFVFTLPDRVPASEPAPPREGVPA